MGLAATSVLSACAVEVRIPEPARTDDVNACLAEQGLEPLDGDMRTPALRDRQLTDLYRCLDRRGAPTILDLRRGGAGG